MFCFERCYDLDELTRSNMHIHTHFSSCAKPEMTFSAIVKEAERCGLTDIALTDHSGPDEKDQISRCFETLKKERDGTDTRVRVRIGSELSLYGVGKYSETPETMRKLEYRLFAQNHYHLRTWEHPEDRSPRGYILHTLACLSELFNTDYADCIAHPIAPIKIKSLENPERLFDSISDNELGGIMEKAENARCAWELHSGVVLTWPEWSRRFFNIGREVGSHFTFASDAHTIAAIDPAPVLPQYKKILL